MFNVIKEAALRRARNQDESKRICDRLKRLEKSLSDLKIAYADLFALNQSQARKIEAAHAKFREMGVDWDGT